MIGCAADPQRERFLEHLIVPHRFVVRVEQYVGVRVDQTWQQGHPGQLDRAGVVGRLDLGFWANSTDRLPIHDNNPAVVGFECDPIPHARWLKHDRPHSDCPRSSPTFCRRVLCVHGIRLSDETHDDYDQATPHDRSFQRISIASP